MVEIFGRVENTRVANGSLVTNFRIPAVSMRLARRRARINSRLKGYSNVSIDGVERVGGSEIPGASVYDVRVISAA